MGDDPLDLYEVFVQWKRGDPPRHEETVRAVDREMALHHAKRNVDRRMEPVSVWVAPQEEFAKAGPDDAISTSTDRKFRDLAWVAQNTPDVTEAGGEDD